MKLTSILITLLFAFILAACGGGGGGSSAPTTTPPDMPTEPTPPEPVDPMVDLMGLSVPADDYMIAAGGTMNVGEGVSEVTLSCSAAADCEFTVADDGTATPTSGEVTAALSDAAQRLISNAADKAAAERIAGLIDPMSERPDANPGTTGSLDADPDPIVVLTAPLPADTAAADHDNFSMPVFGTGALDATTNRPATAVKFTASTDMPATIDGWTGGIYTHTSEDGMTTHTVTKYNDKAADEDEKYSTFFSTANAGSTTHRAGIAVTSITAGVLTLDVGAVTTAGETDRLGGNHGLFTGNFGPTTEGTYTFPGAAAEVTGTFRGVPGTFECAGAGTCTSTHNKDGNLTALGGTWTFEPDGIRTSAGTPLTNTNDSEDNPADALDDALAAIMVPGVKQDPDYMIFGYWIESVTDDDGTTEKMLPFADGKRNYGTLATVAGTATYEGSATGLYMKKTITPQGGVDPSGPYASGQFTADASLTANFTGNDVAVNEQFSVTGTISKFMDGDTAIDEDWSLTLTGDTQARTVNLDGRTAPTELGAFAGTVTADMLAGPDGTFSGAFYGTNAGVAADGTATTGVVLPSSAAGIFDGHFTNGHVRGAFGVNKVDTQ